MNRLRCFFAFTLVSAIVLASVGTVVCKPSKPQSIKTQNLSTKQHVIELTSANQLEKFKTSDTPLVVKFYAEWCGPCRQMQAIDKALAEDFDGTVAFVKINYDLFSEIGKEWKVQSLPSYFCFKKNEKLAQWTGKKGKQEYKESVKKAFNL